MESAKGSRNRLLAFRQIVMRIRDIRTKVTWQVTATIYMM
jgi:hypothetical protein